MKRIAALFLLLLLSQAKAEMLFVQSERISNLEVRKMGIQDRWAYQFVRQTCNKIPTEMLTQATGEAFNAASDLWLLDVTKMKSFYRRSGTSNYLKTIMDSSSLGFALQDCYGDSSDAKLRYITQLMVFDYLGNSMGLVGGSVGVIKVFNVTVKLLLKYGWYPIRNYMTKAIGVSQQKFLWLERALFGVVLVVPVAHAIYDKQQAEKQELNDENEIRMNALIELSELIKSLNEIEDILVKSSDKEFWQTASNNVLKKMRDKCKALRTDPFFTPVGAEIANQCGKINY